VKPVEFRRRVLTARAGAEPARLAGVARPPVPRRMGAHRRPPRTPHGLKARRRRARPPFRPGAATQANTREEQDS